MAASRRSSHDTSRHRQQRVILRPTGTRKHRQALIRNICVSKCRHRNRDFIMWPGQRNSATSKSASTVIAMRVRRCRGMPRSAASAYHQLAIASRRLILAVTWHLASYWSSNLERGQARHHAGVAPSAGNSQRACRLTARGRFLMRK